MKNKEVDTTKTDLICAILYLPIYYFWCNQINFRLFNLLFMILDIKKNIIYCEFNTKFYKSQKKLQIVSKYAFSASKCCQILFQKLHVRLLSLVKELLDNLVL